MKAHAVGCAVGLAVFVAAASGFAQPTPPDDAEIEVGPTPKPQSELDELKEELARLRARVEELEKRPQTKAEPPAPPAKPAAEKPGLLSSILGLSAIDSTAYVQAQYEWHEDSEDQLLQGGQPLNQNRFVLRRGRVRLDAAWTWSALALELDLNTVRGATFSVRRAEASLLWRGPWGPASSDLKALRGDGIPPLMMLSLGVTEIPFGDELTRSSKERVFMERTAGSLAFFPGEPDVGARLSGGVSFFRYSLAVLNGEPLDERSASIGRDKNSAKDFVGRLGVDVKPAKAVRVLGGVSALRGEGFHAGADGTKDGVQWNDLNENGSIEPGELVGAPGAAPSPSENFSRWAFGADARVAFETPIGTTLLYGEVGLGHNMDRGFFVADPVASGIDVRELSLNGALVQELSPYAFVGLRVDYYDPNADFFDSRGGELIPTSQVVRTISPVAGGGIPNQWRVVVQYDNVDDALARDPQGVPTDLANDRFTGRLQVSL